MHSMNTLIKTLFRQIGIQTAAIFQITAVTTKHLLFSPCFGKFDFKYLGALNSNFPNMSVWSLLMTYFKLIMKYSNEM